MQSPQTQPGWVLAGSEMVALGERAGSHIGYPEVDAWWEALTPDQQEETIKDGWNLLRAREVDLGLSEALEIRREADGVLVIEPTSGNLLALHLTADARAVLERTNDETGVALLRVTTAEAVEVIVGVLSAGLGGVVRALSAELPGAGHEVSLFLEESGWRWLSADATIALTPAELPSAILVLVATLTDGPTGTN